MAYSKKPGKKKENQMKNEQNESIPAEETNLENNDLGNNAQEPVADAKEELSETDKLKIENAELKDKILRIYSEFDNFKKRTAKERIDITKAAGTEIILSMVSVIDDFERAQKSISQSTDIEALKAGVDLIYNKFKSLLESKGLEEMKSQGQPFDTDLHEAITNVPAPTEDLKGKVVDELEKGYFLNGKVIRYAKVVVGQ